VTVAAGMRVTSPAPRHAWEEILAASGDATVYQTPAWMDCIRHVDGYEDASRLYEWADGRRLILPMARRLLPVVGLSTEASLPAAWGAGGIAAAGGVQASDVSAVVSELARRRVLRTCVKPGPFADATWSLGVPAAVTRVPHTVHVLDLAGGFDAVWGKRFPSKTRNKIHKAERSGVQVQASRGRQAAAVFTKLYLLSVERWLRRAPGPRMAARWRWRLTGAEPLRKFRIVAERLAMWCTVWIAVREGEPAAALILLKYGSHAFCWRAAMDEQLAGPTRANYLLQRVAIEDACRAGCLYYHMGESSPSLAQFKRAFGAVPMHYVEYRLESVPLTHMQARAQAFAAAAASRAPMHRHTAAA
jgi:Acetyltransferase (GNAT) domain